MSLAVSDESGIWSAHCFYAYDAERNCFIFTSDDGTRHVKMIGVNNSVSVSIALETRIIGKIQGLQTSGIVTRPEGKDYEWAKFRYLKRFPYAVVLKTSFWFYLPCYAKMTDNALGFGKKLIWNGKD